MPSPERNLRQRAWYWAPEDTGGQGQKSFLEPVKIKCRWEEDPEQFMDRSGRTLVSKAVVYVNQDVQEGGALALAAFETDAEGQVVFDDDGEPVVVEPDSLEDEPFDPFASDVGGWEVQWFTKTPDLKASYYERVVYL